MRIRVVSLIVACVAVLLGGGTPAAGGSAPPTDPAPTDPLPVGTTDTGSIDSSGTTRFVFTAPSSGVLTVAVYGDDDLQLSVSHADGTGLPDGQTDRDIFGHRGTEQLLVSIPAAGDYVIAVATYGSTPGTATFEIGATFLSISGREFGVDTDAPTRDEAIELVVGETYTDDEIVLGDLVDWFRLTAEQDGPLLVTVEALEVGPWFHLELSDQERSEVSYNSGSPATVFFDVVAGDTVFAQVSSSGAPAGGYSLRAEYGEADSDGTLADARVLAVGETYDDTGTNPGDREDWFAITAPSDGTLTITTSALGERGPDLQLELHLDERSGAVEFSDQDLDSFTDESLTIDVTAGQTVFVRVRTFGSGVPTQYRITAELN